MELVPSLATVLNPLERGNMRVMSLRQERREQNQRLFQEANRRLHDLVECRLPNLTSVSFLCECADEECVGRVEVTLPLWEDVSQRPNHFLIIDGHPGIEGEEVVESFGPYEVVEKPARVAARQN